MMSESVVSKIMLRVAGHDRILDLHRCTCLLNESFYSSDKPCNWCIDRIQLNHFDIEFSMRGKKFYRVKNKVAVTRDIACHSEI